MLPVFETTLGQHELEPPTDALETTLAGVAVSANSMGTSERSRASPPSRGVSQGSRSMLPLAMLCA